MENLIQKNYYCSICKRYHDITLPKDLAKNRESYPFAHIFLHKMEGSNNIDDAGVDILTTLYIDANMAIRGSEVKRLVTCDIISKDDSKNIVTELMEEMARLQDELTKLQAENKDLKAEIARLKSSR
ncbi:MAG: septum formation initiator family protein [Candidatus Sigynarchaeota archaeon]